MCSARCPGASLLWIVFILRAICFAESPLHAESRAVYEVRTHRDSSGQSSRYLLFQPGTARPASGYPVIMFLNGFGENGVDGLRQISNNFGVDVYRCRQRFPFIAVCPQCSKGGDWSAKGPDAVRALGILEGVINECGGDRDRVYLTGVSAGGTGVWELASLRPDLFAALWPISARCPADLGRVIAANLPSWSFYNSGDRDYVTQSSRVAVSMMLQGGLSPIATEYDRQGHDAWTEAYKTTVVFDWLLKQSKTGNRRSGKYRLWSDEDVVALWQLDHIGQVSRDNGEDDQRIQGLRFVSPELSGDCELHAELQLENGDRREVGLLDANVKQLALIRIELPAVGTGLFSVGDETAKPLDPVAQRSLRVGWNDVRFTKQGLSVHVQLNGWPAAECELPADSRTCRWTVQSANKNELSGLRNLRTRESSMSP